MWLAQIPRYTSLYVVSTIHNSHFSDNLRLPFVTTISNLPFARKGYVYRKQYSSYYADKTRVFFPLNKDITIKLNVKKFLRAWGLTLGGKGANVTFANIFIPKNRFLLATEFKRDKYKLTESAGKKRCM